MVDAAKCLEELAALAGVSLTGGTAYHWDEIEAGLGTRLPADYKVLAEAFPGGWFRQFVRPRKPARLAGGAQRLLGEFGAGQVETLRRWRAQGDPVVPYPVYPEPGGLLPWGGIRDGGYAFWLTGPGEPEGWPVVLASQKCGHWERFDGTVCEFLTEVAAARYDASGFTAGPAAVPAVDWAAVHARLGSRLPADYREFIDTYGPGTFGDIRIMAPGTPGGMDLFALLERKYQQVQRAAVRLTEVAPPIYPEPGGTIFWGETAGGWSCGWAPAGPDPDEWTVAAFMPTADLSGYTLHARRGLSFSSMLEEHARQRSGMRDGLVPRREPDAGPVTFTPYQQA